MLRFGYDDRDGTSNNAVGRLVQDLMYQGGVDQSHVHWVKFDGVGRAVRIGLNFTERGFVIWAPSGCSDRGHTAVSQLSPGNVDWERTLPPRVRVVSYRRHLRRALRNDSPCCQRSNANR